VTANIPDLASGRVSMRGIRPRDAKQLERELMENRAWLRKWEATTPQSFISFDTKASIRSLLNATRFGGALPFALELDGEFVGQLNVSGIVMGSLSSAQLGYWVSQRAAGHGVTPTAVALATDYCFRRLNLHRMEICIRPENAASLRVVEKLGFRYEGLRRRYIHINGDWRDHFSFALTAEEVPEGILQRWLSGAVPVGATHIPPEDIAAAAVGLDAR
jgi:ribosomal-protein-alanine N-acetyltransferase